MFMAAAKALAAVSPARDDPDNNLLSPVTALRQVGFAVALATAIQTRREERTQGVETDAIEAPIRAKRWSPRYLLITAPTPCERPVNSLRRALRRCLDTVRPEDRLY
jgi:malic enzyme